MEEISNSTENPFDEERRFILGNIYLANVKNRLRELTNPNEIDCKRWIWELVQNAKDSISGQKDKTSVDIEIEVKNNKYIFKHNGSPFTIRTLTALLYKYSEGKTNNGESTGRFGTGFLTTHSLSKIVKIKGDIIEKNKTNSQGFSIIMYRDGEDKDLLEGLKKTEKSFITPIESDGWTSYEYETFSTRNKEAGKLGIKYFKENIEKVMLFCPEINSIKLNENGKIFSIIRLDMINNILGECKKIILQINDGKLNFRKTFLYINIEEKNNQLTEKFEKDRNIRICCAIELDKDNNICEDKFSPNLFCSLPLVGSEKHKLPFIINSPDFEPDSERQAILLDGDEINKETGKISDPGINKMILLKAQKMFKSLIDYICKNEIGNRYHLLRGLTSIPDITRFFDTHWYLEHFIYPMRNILLDFPIVWNGKQYKTIKDTYFPNMTYYKNEDDQRKAYNFISQLYNCNIPTFEESKIYEKILWKKDDRIKFIDIEKCTKYIESLETINSLGNISEHFDVWKWMDDFLLFIENYHPDYLKQYAIIPNMYSKFVKLSKELATSKDVPENMIECLTKMNYDWKKNHIHKKILNYSPGIDHNIFIAISKIQSLIKTDNMLILISYIPYDQNEEYIKKRKIIYEFCSRVWTNKMSKERDGRQFPQELWNNLDDIIIKSIIEEMKKAKKISSIFSIDFIDKFIGFLSEYYRSYLNTPIIPNKKGFFCKFNELNEDDNIPDLFKNILNFFCDVDINKELIDQRLTSRKLLDIPKKRIYDYSDKLKTFFNMPEIANNNNFINKNYVALETKKEAAKYLITIIPKESQDENHKKDLDLQNNQRLLFNLYSIFTNKKYNYCEIERNDNNNSIWKYSNVYIYRIIIDNIEQFNDIKSLSKFIGKTEKETVEYLKEFKTFSSEGKIIINQNYKLCYKKKLNNEKIEDNNIISEELKDISKLLDYDVREILAHESMENPCLNNITYNYLCLKIDELVDEKYKNPNNFTDKKYKEAVNYLIEEYFEEIGDIKAKNYFPKIYNNKENIILNVIYDKQTRKNITELGKKFGNNSISVILENSEVIKALMNGELSDKNFHNKNNDLSNNASFTLKNGIKVILNDEIASNEKDIDFYKKSFDNIFQYGDDLDFENSFNKKTGNFGEAYIYELLKNSGKYKNVIWKMLSTNENGEDIEINGKVYNVIPDDSPYDIEVETFDNYKLYIEVKSTRKNMGNKVPFYISQRQIDMMERTKPPDKYILAIVFNVMDAPRHFFMTLDKDNYISI